MKYIKYTCIIIGSVLGVIALLGIYKFNFTNDDIYVTLENGNTVPIDSPEAKHEQTRQTTVDETMLDIEVIEQQLQ